MGALLLWLLLGRGRKQGLGLAPQWPGSTDAGGVVGNCTALLLPVCLRRMPAHSLCAQQRRTAACPTRPRTARLPPLLPLTA